MIIVYVQLACSGIVLCLASIRYARVTWIESQQRPVRRANIPNVLEKASEV